MNDDDIEDLLRRAADGYPLKTDSHDWESVLQRLPVPEIAAANSDEILHRKKNAYLLLLLLIPMVWLCNKYSKHSSKEPVSEIKNATQNAAANNPVADNVVVSFPRPKTRLQEASAMNDEEEKDHKDLPGSGDAKERKFIVFKEQNASNTGVKINKEEQPGGNDKAVEKSGKEVEKDAAVNAENQSSIYAVDSSGNDIAEAKAVDNAIAKEPDSARKEEIRTVAKKPQSIKKASGFLYAGLLAGADVTMVKFQSVKNAGYTIGFLAGYQISPKIGVETGLNYNRKYYYSDGKYFKSPYNNNNRKFTTVTGDCKMLEVPLNFTYKLATKSKFNLFASGGVSSYFMRGEQYDYTYTSWGQEYNDSYNHNKASSYLFSSLNVSLGYSKYIGNSLLRLEPYLKVSLRGIGAGKLPITSAGLYIVLSKRVGK